MIECGTVEGHRGGNHPDIGGETQADRGRDVGNPVRRAELNQVREAWIPVAHGQHRQGPGYQDDRSQGHRVGVPLEPGNHQDLGIGGRCDRSREESRPDEGSQTIHPVFA